MRGEQWSQSVLRGEAGREEAEKLVNPPDYYCLQETVSQPAREGTLLEISVLALERAWEWGLLHSLIKNPSLLPRKLGSGDAVCSLFLRSSSL